LGKTLVETAKYLDNVTHDPGLNCTCATENFCWSDGVV